MRIGLFGGSFDPIHWGHVRPVLAAAEELGLDRVVYLPTGRPPHKPQRRMAPALARYAMTELALLDFDHLHVSGLELSEAAPSYTVDTLEHFRAASPADELHLLVGADSYAELRSWHRWRDILTMARVAVLARPPVTSGSAAGASVIASPPPASVGPGPAHPHGGSAAGRPSSALLERGLPPARMLATPPLAVSSTEVRRRLAKGERPPAEWVPEPVVDFALKYRLYR